MQHATTIDGHDIIAAAEIGGCCRQSHHAAVIDVKPIVATAEIGCAREIQCAAIIDIDRVGVVAFKHKSARCRAAVHIDCGIATGINKHQATGCHRAAIEIDCGSARGLNKPHAIACGRGDVARVGDGGRSFIHINGGTLGGSSHADGATVGDAHHSRADCVNARLIRATAGAAIKGNRATVGDSNRAVALGFGTNARQKVIVAVATLNKRQRRAIIDRHRPLCLHKQGGFVFAAHEHGAF